MKINLTGTRYFDDNWFYSGIGDRKESHITDFIDSAIFLKEKGLAKKLGAIGLGESGSLTALTSILTEPLLFDAAAVKVYYLYLNFLESNHRFSKSHDV